MTGTIIIGGDKTPPRDIMEKEKKYDTRIEYRDVDLNGLDPGKMSHAHCLGNEVGCYLKERFGGHHRASHAGFSVLFIGKNLANDKETHFGICAGAPLIPSMGSSGDPEEDEMVKKVIGGTFVWEEGPRLQQWLESMEMKDPELYQVYMTQYREWKDGRPEREAIAVGMMRSLSAQALWYSNSFEEIDENGNDIAETLIKIHMILDDGDLHLAAKTMIIQCKEDPVKMGFLAKQLNRIKQAYQSRPYFRKDN